jgi:phage terminase small subunit
MAKTDKTAALLHRMAKPKPTKADLKAKAKLSTKKAAVSEQHRAVIDAYFANGCVSQRRALRECGYAETTAVGNPHSVFQRDDVRAEIDRRHKLQSRRRDITEDNIKAEYAKVAFASLGDLLEVNEDGSAYLDMAKITEDQKAALAEYQVESYTDKEDGGEGVKVKKSRIKFHSKLAALDSLARIMGMFKDKVEVSGTMSLVERIAKARERTHAAMKGDIT